MVPTLVFLSTWEIWIECPAPGFRSAQSLPFIEDTGGMNKQMEELSPTPSLSVCLSFKDFLKKSLLIKGPGNDDSVAKA